eukprot:scaffold1954_cov364-Prasinococcus_capsulatus_cf.AAC.9
MSLLRQQTKPATRIRAASPRRHDRRWQRPLTWRWRASPTAFSHQPNARQALRQLPADPLRATR